MGILRYHSDFHRLKNNFRIVFNIYTYDIRGHFSDTVITWFGLFSEATTIALI